MSDDKQPQGQSRLSRAVGGAGLAAVLVAAVAGFEGDSDKPYRDLIGKWTVCYGQTDVPMRDYSPQQCRDMLAGSLAQYVDQVRKVDPDLSGPQLVAATSLEYNIGEHAYARSSVARDFRIGRTRQACNAFVRFSYAAGRQVAGLLKRREQERQICLTGVS